jgi:hypothetical protein
MIVFMRSIRLLSFFSLVIFLSPALYGRSNDCRPTTGNYPGIQDTLDKQLLFNGRVWRNLYYKVRGNQFLFSDSFIPCTIVINGKTFPGCSIKYDIFNDELLTKAGQNIIIQLNKEMVEAFTFNYNFKTWRFLKFQKDSLNDLTGYVNLLYQGNVLLYVKYRKVILPLAVDNEYDEFAQTQKMYLMKDGKIYPVGNRNDVIALYSSYKQQIKNFIRINKVKISKKSPESFLPLIEYCDKLGH